MEFPNLSFTSELADSASPQFHLQAQALDNYVSGSADTCRDTARHTHLPSILFLCCCSHLNTNHVFAALSFPPFPSLDLLIMQLCIPTFTSSLLPFTLSKCKAETGAVHAVCVCLCELLKNPRETLEEGSGDGGGLLFRAEDKPGVCQPSARPREQRKRVRRRAELQ